MNLLDNFARAVLSVLGTFARIMLSVLDFVEGTLRALMKGAGLTSDVQTLLLCFVIVMFLVGVMRLLRGRIRMSVALFLILILAHTLERVAHGPIG